MGVFLDDKLKFNEYANYISKKISKSIGVICRIRMYIPNSVLLNLYYTIIYPYLTYCNVIWCGTYWSHLNSIWLQQKRAIRVINWKPPRYHTSELFSGSKILKLSDIHALSLGIFMFTNQSHPKFVRNATLNFPHYFS